MVTTQAYNIQVVVWHKYKKLLIIAVYREIGNSVILSGHADVLYEQLLKYADWNCNYYQPWLQDHVHETYMLDHSCSEYNIYFE